eukprot:CAMPEP_0196996626 /NCGR_PEP_ID=MMETSP1380-20130617/2453_1 /TAXON_ID=5936 /ORGANISM="Euplotes crassus, Strain CT5" /LENGTH=334 /DNA_ID=CAMNT_0042412655 /DNA_START=761 /DNA_END=1765 /DNA_ORIENTATION=-
MPWPRLDSEGGNSGVCLCQNLIHFAKTITNPSIRENFISTRFFGMSFIPSKPETVEQSLIKLENLKYMPTYENNDDGRYLQFFISEDFINSLHGIQALGEGLGNVIIENKRKVANLDCGEIAYLFYKYARLAKNCNITVYLHEMQDIDITAGQLHLKNTTLVLEFNNPLKEGGMELLAQVFFKIELWMSFIMVEGFILQDIHIGDPGYDYFIHAWETQESKLGDLKKDADIMSGFEKQINRIITKDYKLNLYERYFKDHEILRNLSPTFENIRLDLVDRYFTIFVQPQFGTFLEVLKNLGCSKPIRSRFWMVVCVDLIDDDFDFEEEDILFETK